MRLKPSVSPILAIFLCLLSFPLSITALCDKTAFHNSTRLRDFEAVQEFVNSKRTIPQVERTQYFKMSGDIRSEFYYRIEKGVIPVDPRDTNPFATDLKYGYIRGHGAPWLEGLTRPVWTDQLILKWQLDYKCDRMWGQAKVEFDNDGGIQESSFDCARDKQGLFGSGFCNDICLKRAFFGYRVIECPKSWTFDIEIGRRPLNTIFESYVQFKNRFDGILFRYDRELPPHSKCYVYAGPFLVDERVDHWAFVGEVGVFNFKNWMLDLRYSYIDWAFKHRFRCGERQPLEGPWSNEYRWGKPYPSNNPYRISQWTVDYNFKKETFGRKAQLYGAFLWNHAAPTIKRSAVTGKEIGKRENLGGYIGFLIGEVRKTGDWAMDISYELIQAQAIPDSDVNGISRGNAERYSFTMNERGKCNYKGWEFQFLYAITDHWQANIIYDDSIAANPDLGGRHAFRKLEIDLILKF